MSYGDTWDDSKTYMQYDIAALQELYGADFTMNGGNTVYTWSRKPAKHTSTAFDREPLSPTRYS